MKLANKREEQKKAKTQFESEILSKLIININNQYNIHSNFIKNKYLSSPKNRFIKWITIFFIFTNINVRLFSIIIKFSCPK